MFLNACGDEWFGLLVWFFVFLWVVVGRSNLDLFYVQWFICHLLFSRMLGWCVKVSAAQCRLVSGGVKCWQSRVERITNLRDAIVSM